MKIIIYIICILSFSSIYFPQSYALDRRVELIYGEFTKKVQARYSSKKQEEIYMKLQRILWEYTYKGLSLEKKNLLSDMISLNNEMLFQKWILKNLWQSEQKLYELKERLALEKKLKNQTYSKNVEKLISSVNINYLAIDENREFVKDGDIYAIEYSRYFSIEDNPISALKKKKGIVIPLKNGWYGLVESYNFNKKIPYSQLGEKLLGFIISDYRVLKKEGTFYGYNFKNIRFFNDKYGVYQDQLDAGWFTKDNTLVYKDEKWRYNLVTDYQVYKLIKENDIFWVPQKHLILDYLREDSKYQSPNISQILWKIRKKSKSLTFWKSREESIEAIYAWILDNVSYSSNIDLNNQKIFSWVETFNNFDGVCTGYARLAIYLFTFAGIYDTEVLKWHVIDAPDFPQIWHAWVRIGNKYYDPTFDDPIGAKETKKREQYKYFWLPKDIFYANRFDYGSLPEIFKTASKKEIQQYIFTYLTKLLPKYEWLTDSYKVFAPIEFRNKYAIPASETITPELLARKIGSYKVDNNSFRFKKWSQIERISHIKYYPLTVENTQNVLSVLGYDISEYTLFDWQLDDGTRQWRLAYELTLR